MNKSIKETMAMNSLKSLYHGSLICLKRRTHRLLAITTVTVKYALLDQGKFKRTTTIVVILQCRNGSIVSKGESKISIPEANHGNNGVGAAVIQTADQYIFPVTRQVVMRIDTQYPFKLCLLSP